MKPELKRIEATLDQLGVQHDSPTSSVASSVADSPRFSHRNDRSWDDRGWSEQHSTPQAHARAKLQVEPFPLPGDSPDLSSPSTSTESVFASVPAKEQTEAKLPVLPAHQAVEPVASPLPDDHLEVPTLPASEFPSLSPQRHAANPNLAIGLLKEIEALVRGWQKELEQAIQQIQAIYQEGPIVDGWLESYPPGGQAAPPSASVSMLRHAEIEQLMTFIEQICQTEKAQITEDMRRTSYRLCGLDPDGKIWSRPCPSEQVPYVGLAIARYQKLRSLLTKKQNLENRLTSLVESLTMLHGQSGKGEG